MINTKREKRQRKNTIRYSSSEFYTPQSQEIDFFIVAATYYKIL